MIQPKKLFIFGVKKLRFLNSVAVRLTFLTGKSPIPVHPKHLINLEKPWYLPYLNNKDSVLDLGCGNGQNTLKAAPYVKSIIGVDYDSTNLHQARMLTDKSNVNNVSFLKADLEHKLPFKPESFEKVLFLDALEHLQHDVNALKETFRVLKKEGTLLISLPNSQTSWKKLQRKYGLNSFTDADHKREYSKSEIIKLLTNQHFELIQISSITYDTALAPLIDLTGGISLTLYSRLTLWKKHRIHKNPLETTGYRIVAKKIS